MPQKAIVLILLLFCLIIFGMFQYALLKSAERNQSPSTTTPPVDVVHTPEPEPDNSQEYDDVNSELLPPNPAANTDSRVQYAVDFAAGTHTISGTVEMPNPCYEITTEVVVMESFPEQILVSLAPQQTAEVCAQVVTDVPFVAEAQASAEATVLVRLLTSEPIEI